MFLLLFFLSFSSEMCQSQMIYSRIVPNDPRFILQRPPVRRSAMEALERLRMPVARYYPQVENQLPAVPYQPPSAPMAGYQIPADDVYALPAQWTDDFVQQLPERADEDDYGNYEYENVFAPVYRPGVFADEVYAPEPVVDPEPSDNNLYNDYMVNYFLGGSESMDPVPQPEPFELQRRSDNQDSAESSSNKKDQGVIQLDNVLEANKNATPAQSAPSTLTPPAPIPSQVPPQVQMTAVPSAPEKKEIKSLVIPEPVAQTQNDRSDSWREMGQKEEPLFRPLQNSQRTTWEVLTRAKNSVQKRPIPLLKKMIQNSQQQQVVDPLTQELQNLKKEHQA